MSKCDAAEARWWSTGGLTDPHVSLCTRHRSVRKPAGLCKLYGAYAREPFFAPPTTVLSVDKSWSMNTGDFFVRINRRYVEESLEVCVDDKWEQLDSRGRKKPVKKMNNEKLHSWCVFFFHQMLLGWSNQRIRWAGRTVRMKDMQMTSINLAGNSETTYVGVMIVCIKYITVW